MGPFVRSMQGSSFAASSFVSLGSLVFTPGAAVPRVPSSGHGDEEFKDAPHPEEELSEEALEEQGMSLRVRYFVYFGLCLAVQMFMSYDGGATPASMDVIQARLREDGQTLSQTEASLLGCLDKVGQTLAAVVWGRLLQLLPTKLLLVSSLGANALFALTFGFVRSKKAMFLAQFMRGVTESLQGVWGTVWTLSYAPPNRRTQWMGLGAIAAGLGNGIGTMVAGYGTANGLPYSFAYAVQASVLALLWLILIATPSSLLVPPNRPEDFSGSAQVDAPGARAQFRALLSNRLYMRSLICIALILFINSGVQFLWVRLFVQGPFMINKNLVVTGFLVITGVGSFIGVLLGPRIIDSHGGYGDKIGRYVSLVLLKRMTAVAAFGAGMAMFGISVRMALGGRTMGILWDPWLWEVGLAIMVLFIGINSTIATVAAINAESVPRHMQEFAVGLTGSAQNLLGYAGGILLPGIAMDASYQFYNSIWPTSLTTLEAWQMSLGFFCVASVAFLLFLAQSFAVLTAKRLMHESGELSIASDR